MSQNDTRPDSSADSEKRRKNKRTGTNFPQQGQKVGSIVVSGRGTKQGERKWADPEPPAAGLTEWAYLGMGREQDKGSG